MVSRKFVCTVCYWKTSSRQSIEDLEADRLLPISTSAAVLNLQRLGRIKEDCSKRRYRQAACYLSPRDILFTVFIDSIALLINARFVGRRMLPLKRNRSKR